MTATVCLLKCSEMEDVAEAMVKSLHFCAVAVVY